MSSRPFRFLHASDFHLEQVPHGMAETPEPLRDLLVDSAYAAAQRVFDAALAEEVELLVLSGDILQAEQTGPRGPLFLLEQFARLAERGIPVYWAGGAVDPPELWPAVMPLPEGVYRFPRGRVSELVHRRDGAPLARLLGISRNEEEAIRADAFAADPAGLYTIAVAHGAIAPAALPLQGVDYWALGGRHERANLVPGDPAAHYPGSPQGRCPAETGAHGCTLVHVDEQRQARTGLVPSDVLRWLHERVVLDSASGPEDLKTLLRERMHTLVEAAPKLDLLITWTVAGGGPLISPLRRGNLVGELLAWLRSEYAGARPAAWSLAIEVEGPDALRPEWYEQESIRGDFLRTIRQLELAEGAPLGLDAYLAEKYLAGAFGAEAALENAGERQHVLREAALLGVDLLTGEEE